MFYSIDAGNSRFKCAVPDMSGNPQLITNRFGEPFTPSAVFFAVDGSVIVGSEALNAGFVEPERLVVNWKRAMGTETVLYTDGDGKEYKAMDILAILLADAKEAMETKTGQIVNEVVITVPANYTDIQKQQTIDASESVGMKVLVLPHEPTAAALGNGLHKHKNCVSVVYDLGGGTFDVSIVRSHGNVFDIIATGGDPKIGGRDFNDRVAGKLLEEFESANGFLPSKEEHAIFFQEMAQKIEQLKISLSVQAQAQIVLFCQGKQLQVMVMREQFNSWIKDLAQKTINKTAEVIADANLEMSDIDMVYAVGGGSLMPIITEMIEELTGKKVSKKCEPHCAAAFGGVLSGRIECQRQNKECIIGDIALPGPDTLIHEILSHTIGVLVLSDGERSICSEILGNDTPVPSMQTKTFKLVEPGQTAVTIEILEGRHGADAKDCIKLGHFELTDLPPRPDMPGRIEITFSLDSNGILTAKARDNVSGKEEQMQLEYEINSAKPNAA